MKKLNWKIALIIVFIVIIILFIIWYYNKNKIKNNNIDSNRFVVKCVPDCADDEICIKGACVKKKIDYTL